MFEDTVLLSLRRQYSKDEAVAVISDALKKAQMENGMLKSEISELTDQVNLLKEQIPKGFKDLRDQQYAVELRKQIKSCQDKNKPLQESITQWQNKYFQIYQKIRNMIQVEAVQDESGHWYVIPHERVSEFYTDSEDYDFCEFGEFDAKWGKYRTGGALGIVKLYADI